MPGPLLQIFVSHSSRDADAAARLIALLRAALSLSASVIRCTSVDGYRLPGGADTNARLRKEVNNARVLLGIISENGLRSLYVVFELGARWGSGKPFVPLLAPGTPASMLGGPLSTINALRLDNRAQVQQLLSDLSDQLERPLESAEVYDAALNEFMKIMDTLQSESIAATLRARARAPKQTTAGTIEETGNRLTIPIGLASHYFSTDPELSLSVLKDCLVLVCADQMASIRPILPILEQVAVSERPLLLVARGVVGELLATLIKNAQIGTIRACVVSTARRHDAQDIERLVAQRTGAVIFNDEAGESLQYATMQQLGHAARVECRQSTTIIETV